MLEVADFIVSPDGKRGLIRFTDGSVKYFESISGQVRVYMFAWLTALPMKVSA